MEMNFCRRCGAALQNVENHIFKCANGHTIYINGSPTVGVFLFNNDGKILLSVRGIEPHKGMLDAFGGFLDGAETVEAALERELQEELGLESSDYSSPQYICSGVGHYPYEGETLILISTLFWARLTTDKKLTPQDDVADVVTMDIDDVDLDRLHDKDIVLGIQTLRASRAWVL